MKIIGRNSASTYISYALLTLSIIFSIIYIYEIFGLSVLYYNFRTGSHILNSFFLLNEDVGWSHNKWTNTMDGLLKFKIYLPFTSQNLLTGVFEPNFIYTKIVSGLYITLFAFFSSKIFKEISSQKVFNRNAIVWLKRFAWLNIFFTLILNSIAGFISAGHIFATTFNGFSYLFFGILILFVTEFFKKGYELQSENDLTI
ncbi:hypothetical protein ASG01_08065 [Chryseobacterium sp. Leaf180]|uniref:DUF2975 domain-containing protein n=1 Tax=Chryseobacterium sp. Leaf180 TaxID=1736289 RepID=UPI0006F7825F|nr:DUF2975 domain-containing protein [Chryseobacterium sp. Leaf180]KQR93808.1 hypothetical protein ASG01_08065 [Chryseobacterium sp. Leaf180]